MKAAGHKARSPQCAHIHQHVAAIPTAWPIAARRRSYSCSRTGTRTMPSTILSPRRTTSIT